MYTLFKTGYIKLVKHWLKRVNRVNILLIDMNPLVTPSLAKFSLGSGEEDEDFEQTRPGRLEGLEVVKMKDVIWLVLSLSFFFKPFWERLPRLTNIFGKALNHQLVLLHQRFPTPSKLSRWCQVIFLLFQNWATCQLKIFLERF